MGDATRKKELVRLFETPPYRKTRPQPVIKTAQRNLKKDGNWKHFSASVKKIS